MSPEQSSVRPCGSVPHGLAALARILDVAPSRLRANFPDHAGTRPAPGKWSPKEELGHLLDSASNNHQRIVRAQLEDRPAMPGYDGDAWVKLQRYQEREWHDVIDLWLAFNRQLIAAARAAPESAWSRTLTIGGRAPVTLGFVLDEYVDHMVHHLKHIGIDAGALPPGRAPDR